VRVDSLLVSEIRTWFPPKASSTEKASSATLGMSTKFSSPSAGKSIIYGELSIATLAT
jgi:hypothetical protein